MEERIEKLEEDVKKLKQWAMMTGFESLDKDFDEAFEKFRDFLEKESLDTGISNNSKN